MVSAPKPPCGRRVVAIGGCIAQRDGEKIRKNIPVADVVFGTSALASLPSFSPEAFSDDGSVVEVDTGEEGRGFSADLPSRRGAALPRLGAHHAGLQQLLHVLHRPVRPRTREKPHARGRRGRV